MKLDERILPGKRPLGCFDTEAAKAFLGKKGYFNNNLSRFCYLKNCNQGCLRNIFVQNEKCFVAISDYPDTDYKYFLPDAWLKPEEQEKKYRPFSLNEFLKIFDIGDIVEFRNKNCDEFYRVMFIGYITNSNRSMDEKPGEIDVMLGNYLYSLSHLFEDYELFFEDEWQPFGVYE